MTSTMTTASIFGNLSREVPADAVENSEKFLEAVGLDYEVEKTPAYGVQNGDDVPSVVKNQHHLRRSDGHIVSPHTVTDIYVPLQPSDLTAVLDYLVSEGFVKYDSAWLTHDGQRETIACRMDFDSPIPGDSSPMHYYLLAQNAHAAGAAKFRGFGFRPGCSNMFASLFACALAFRHTTNIRSRLEFGRRLMERITSNARSVAEKMGKLGSANLAQHGGLERVVDFVLGIRDAEKVSAQKETQRADLTARVCDPTQHTYGRTLYDVLNAVTSQNTHWTFGRGGKTPQGIMSSLLDSSRGDFEREAFKRLCTLAGC